MRPSRKNNHLNKLQCSPSVPLIFQTFNLNFSGALSSREISQTIHLIWTLLQYTLNFDLTVRVSVVLRVLKVHIRHDSVRGMLWLMREMIVSISLPPAKSCSVTPKCWFDLKQASNQWFEVDRRSNKVMLQTRYQLFSGCSKLACPTNTNAWIKSGTVTAAVSCLRSAAPGASAAAADCFFPLQSLLSYSEMYCKMYPLTLLDSIQNESYEFAFFHFSFTVSLNLTSPHVWLKSRAANIWVESV